MRLPASSVRESAFLSSKFLSSGDTSFRTHPWCLHPGFCGTLRPGVEGSVASVEVQLYPVKLWQAFADQPNQIAVGLVQDIPGQLLPGSSICRQSGVSPGHSEDAAQVIPHALLLWPSAAQHAEARQQLSIMCKSLTTWPWAERVNSCVK